MIDSTFTDERGHDAFESLKLFIQNLDVTVEDLTKAGDYIVPQIVNRTLSGRDVDGEDFAPYSPTYYFRKKDARVTLRGSGKGPHMLDALAFQVPSNSSLEVGIFDNPELAERAKAQNEGAEIRTRLGAGPEGRLLHPGRRVPKGKKTTLIIPARHWLGANVDELLRMEEIIANSAIERAARK